MNGKISMLLTSYFLLLTSYFLLPASHALTRAELVDRFRAVPVVKLDGLVQVVANCPATMRREYQLPIAGYAADVCRALYSAEQLKPRRFIEPGIVIHIGDMTNAVTNVVARTAVRTNGAKYTKIYLPAPAFSDRRALTCATACAYFLAVHDETVSPDKAWHALLNSNPDLRAAETDQRLGDWSERGLYGKDCDDESYLALARKVLHPGHLTPYERRQFVSHLDLYPLAYDAPFCGTYDALDFATAVRLRKRDLGIRFAAFVKAKQILILGAGRGEELQMAAEAYSDFLTELGRDEKTDGELLALLATAEDKLRAVRDH